MSDKKSIIAKPEEINEIEKNSIDKLPINPTAQGYSGSEVRRIMAQSITGRRGSVLALLIEKLKLINDGIDGATLKNIIIDEKKVIIIYADGNRYELDIEPVTSQYIKEVNKLKPDENGKVTLNIKDVPNLLETLTDLQNRVDVLETDNTLNKERLDGLDLEITRLDIKDTEQDTKINENKNNINDINTELVRLDDVKIEQGALDGFVVQPTWDKDKHILTLNMQGYPALVVDLPSEYAFHNIRVEGDNLILTREEGTEVVVSLSGLLNGMASEEWANENFYKKGVGLHLNYRDTDTVIELVSNYSSGTRRQYERNNITSSSIGLYGQNKNENRETIDTMALQPDLISFERTFNGERLGSVSLSNNGMSINADDNMGQTNYHKKGINTNVKDAFISGFDVRGYTKTEDLVDYTKKDELFKNVENPLFPKDKNDYLEIHDLIDFFGQKLIYTVNETSEISRTHIFDSLTGEIKRFFQSTTSKNSNTITTLKNPVVNKNQIQEDWKPEWEELLSKTKLVAINNPPPLLDIFIKSELEKSKEGQTTIIYNTTNSFVYTHTRFTNTFGFISRYDRTTKENLKLVNYNELVINKTSPDLIWSKPIYETDLVDYRVDLERANKRVNELERELREIGSDSEVINKNGYEIDLGANAIGNVKVDMLAGGKNLAVPDLTGKEYLGNGKYLVSNRANIITNYNVFDGIYNPKGDFLAIATWFLHFPVVKNETYTITYLPISNNGFSGNIYFEWEGGSVSPMSINSPRTFTVDNINSDYIWVSLQLNGNYDFNFKLQIEKGDTATDYEVPYINATTLKRLSIQNSTINEAIPDLTGKEYLGNGEYFIHTSSGIDYTYNVYSGVWTLNGTKTGAGSSFPDFNLSDGVTRSTSFIHISGTYNKESEYSVFYPNLNNVGGSQNIPLNQDAIYWNGIVSTMPARFFFGSGGPFTFNDYKFKLQIEKGSTATPYVLPIFNENNIHSELFIKPKIQLQANDIITYNKGNFLLNDTVLNTSGLLVAQPNTKLVIENITNEVNTYGSELLYNIVSIKKLLKINQDGTETPIDLSTTTINNNKFTTPQLNNNDLFYIVYEFETVESPLKAFASYYNSDKIVIDEATDKVYKWKVKINNGVPELIATEVE